MNRGYQDSSPIVPARPKHLDEALSQLFTTEDRRRDWMNTPAPALSGRRPVDVVAAGNVDDVVRVLIGLAHGNVL